MTVSSATESIQASHAASRRRRKGQARASLARWFGAKDTCDRCARSMVDHRQRGCERICIVCVELEREATDLCDRCDRPMLEFRERGRQRICIQCVELEVEERPKPLAPPEVAGCTAALRALLVESRHLATAHTEYWKVEHLTAAIDTALVLVWWLTPPNIRLPGHDRIDEASITRLLTAYEETRGLRATATSLVGAFRQWRLMQLRAAQYAELAEVDRRYAALTQRESVVRATPPAEQQATAAADKGRGSPRSLDLQRFETRRAG
jgi:hypothetical protein